MRRLVQYLLQGAFYLAFAVLIGAFSNAPSYQYLAADAAVIKLSFSHSGKPIRECRRLSPEEIATLAPNMRRPTDCPRERVALRVELLVDETMVFAGDLQPSGLAKDGASTVYETFKVTPGQHNIKIRMRDSTRTTGFDYQYADTVEIKALQNFVIDFRAETGGFKFL